MGGIEFIDGSFVENEEALESRNSGDIDVFSILNAPPKHLTATWSHCTPIHLVSTDSGSEFGKHPFGGALFGEAVRRLTGSFLNAVTVVPELR